MTEMSVFKPNCFLGKNLKGNLEITGTINNQLSISLPLFPLLGCGRGMDMPSIGKRLDIGLPHKMTHLWEWFFILQRQEQPGSKKAKQLKLLVSPFLSYTFWGKCSSCDAFKHTLVRYIFCWKSHSWFDAYPIVPLYHAKCSHPSKSGLLPLGTAAASSECVLGASIPLV